MRNRISGGIGVVWGGAILGNHFLSGHGLDVSTAYSAGASAAVVFGAALLLVGSYYLAKG